MTPTQASENLSIKGIFVMSGSLQKGKSGWPFTDYS
ncbi:MAG: hypothetical protein ACJA1A_000087 [Saprospiraceae bacterium]|jgi:hypothetical protein